MRSHFWLERIFFSQNVKVELNNGPPRAQLYLKCPSAEPASPVEPENSVASPEACKNYRVVKGHASRTYQTGGGKVTQKSCSARYH